MEHRPSIYSNNILRDGPTTDNVKNFKYCFKTKDLPHIGFQNLQIPMDRLALPLYQIDIAQKWLVLTGKNGKVHRFPLQTIQPKVQMTHIVPSKQLPLDVEVDRRRRQYAQVDFIAELLKVGLTEAECAPTLLQYYELSEDTYKHFLPLAFFDNSDFDIYSPEAWFKLGMIENFAYPLPAKAFIPRNNDVNNFGWQYVAVKSFDKDRHLWTVMSLEEETVHEVPKVQTMFLAEDPFLYVKRLGHALVERNKAEILIMMETIVDCVLMEDLKENRFRPNAKIDALISRLTANYDATITQNMRTEVYLVFEHLMACYEFERFVKLLPKEFPQFTTEIIRCGLPTKYTTPFAAQERKYLERLKLDIKDLRYRVLRATLFYIPAGIEAMMNVVVECQYVETLTLFVCSFAKPLTLNDFLQQQQQNSSHVGHYLKNFWPAKLSSGITIVLRAQGRGWLDISLGKWSVYVMCKISRFILQVRLRMQESIEVVLEHSIENFARFLIDPCRQFLKLEWDYVWTSDYIHTEFPWVKPIFSLLIGISDNEKVTFSTNPADFQPALLDIFKKALEKTNGIRCIDAETMTNLRFPPNLYILTVELIEDLYVRYKNLMKRCYSKAVIPLRAYARKYERFIFFYNLQLTDFMYDYQEAKKPSMQVKLDILEYKRQKDEVREILPPSITIGPFYLIIDPIKQFMIRKYTEIVKRLFEYYIQRMYDVNEALLEECLTIYNKIAERPQSIEHLYDIRDYALLVPDKVEQLKADIQIMWLEYDLLDSFFYNLSDTQFAMKWQVFAWPHNIMQRLSTLREEQKNDIEEFRRIHLGECLAFEERLESLNDEIQAFSLIFDPNRVVETAVEVKKTWKIITELQKMGEVLTFRQTLFEMDEFSLEFLNSIIDGFNPYRNMWSACSDLIKLQEATEGNPLITIELDEVGEAIIEIRATLEESCKVFNEKEEVAAVATTYLEKLEEFIPVYKCIKWLKNENWLYMHWQELSNRGNMEIKFSAAMNFQYCARKGIMQNLDLVQEISEKAEFEADAFRKALEEEERAREEAAAALILRKAQRKCRTDIL